MALLILFGLIAASMALTLAMQLLGGVFTMTVLLGTTTRIAPAWLLPLELLLGLAFFRRQRWAMGIPLALAVIVGEELYLADATGGASPLSLRFQAAHMAIFALISLAALPAWKAMGD